MRILIAIPIVLGALIATATPAAAQSLILISICVQTGAGGPTLSHIEPSEAVDVFCSDLTPDNLEFCQGVADISERAGTGMPCAEASVNVYTLGFEHTFLESSAVTRPANAREATHVFQNNQTNLQFVMQRANGGVDLVGCGMSTGNAPDATYLQMSDGGASDVADLSCADAIQRSVDAGGVLSAGRSSLIGGATHSAVRRQQGRVALDDDFNEADRPKFVMIRVGLLTNDSD